MMVASAAAVAKIASVAVIQWSMVATRISGPNMTCRSLGLHISAGISVG